MCVCFRSLVGGGYFGGARDVVGGGVQGEEARRNSRSWEGGHSGQVRRGREAVPPTGRYHSGRMKRNQPAAKRTLKNKKRKLEVNVINPRVCFGLSTAPAGAMV